MVQDNGKFRISLAMAEYLKLSPLPPRSKKLLLALIYLQEIEDEAWPKVLFDYAGDSFFEGQPLKQHFAYVSQLNALGFAPRSNSSRFLADPVSDLNQLNGFFDHLSVTYGRDGYISWQFGVSPAALMTDMDRYALMLAQDIEHCSCELDVPLITQITLRQRMRYPSFSLLHPDPACNFDIAVEVPAISDPRPFKAKLKRTLKKWATLKEYRFVAVLHQTGKSPGITDITIRISHEKSEWTEKQLLQIHPRSRLIDVKP